MLTWALGITAALIGLWAGYTQLYEGGLGQPNYTVLSSQDGVEFRRYDPFVIASTPLAVEGESGMRGGFRVLAGYIFGDNQQDTSLAMTAPVIQQSQRGESLPMTAPVLQSPEGMNMAFVMPADQTVESLPTPNSEQVHLSTVDWGEVAVIRLSGRGKQAHFRSAEATLREVLASNQRTAKAPALYAQYNSPSAFPPLRRNEVIVQLNPE